ncbi:MAG: hypothetical protein ACI9SC_003100 [Gammaproteobacteria bacterium]|jgi:hypothetical protein
MSTGNCLCGAIEYEYTEPPDDCCYCHCSICRKLTGSAFAAYGTIEKTAFKWSKGEDRLSIYQPTSSTTRFNCSQCGSLVASEHSLEPESVFISLGTLNGRQELKIKYHQFTGSKAPWHRIEDDIPQFNEWPDEF